MVTGDEGLLNEAHRFGEALAQASERAERPSNLPEQAVATFTSDDCPRSHFIKQNAMRIASPRTGNFVNTRILGGL